MSWEYRQGSGNLYHNGQLVANGYSGHGAAKNQPDLENQPFEGPIPRGRYTIGQAETTGKGVYTMRDRKSVV